MHTQFTFDFTEADNSSLKGKVTLEKAQEKITKHTPILYKSGELEVNGNKNLKLCFVHSKFTKGYIYTYKTKPNPNFFRLLDIDFPDKYLDSTIRLPGQLVFGFERTKLVNRAIRDVFRTDIIEDLVKKTSQDNIITIPILREGIKYQINESLHSNYGYLCEEIVTDSHHEADPTVAGYGRRGVLKLFKDQDISQEQRKNVEVAFIGDSIASGITLLIVLNKLAESYPNLRNVEIIAPLAALRGLARLGNNLNYNFFVRIHLFETVLNAMPPDYYYSAHYPYEELHFDMDEEQKYKDWWGQDNEGNWVSETACAGFGWSEAFFNPRKQKEMIDEQLNLRNKTSIKKIIQRNIENGKLFVDISEIISAY